MVLKRLLLLGCIIGLGACSTSHVEVVRFTNGAELNPGDSAKIEWEFRNADYVAIDGMKDNFETEGSLVVKPETSRDYKFTAIRKGYDTLIKISSIKIKESIATGAEAAPVLGMAENQTPSTTLAGIQMVKNNLVPENVKIIRTLYPNSHSGDYAFRFLLLDKNGNYLRSKSMANETDAIIKKLTDEAKLNVKSISEVWEANPTQSNNIAILVENSFSTDSASVILNGLKQLSNDYRITDKVWLSFFNHEYDGIKPLLEFKESNISNASTKPQSGLNSTYKSAIMAMQDLAKANAEPEAMIIILSSPDNSSVLFDANDVVNVARAKDIPVYVIALGNEYNSYSLDYITDYTGGRFYNLEEPTVEQIENTLLEIMFAQKTYYEAQFEYTPQANEKSVSLDFNCSNGSFTGKETKSIILQPVTQYSDYQALAVFAQKDTTLEATFVKNLELLAQVLKANPEMTAELTGHSGLEGSMEMCDNLGLFRAQAVRRALIDYGVLSTQVRIQTDGCNKPVYFIEQNPWQTILNRRVDMRWMIPSQLPYEILAESANSEEKALTIVEEWESRGYKSYYERYLVNYTPYYRIKLWGYAAFDEAEKVANSLKKKYKNISFTVR